MYPPFSPVKKIIKKKVTNAATQQTVARKAQKVRERELADINSEVFIISHSAPTAQPPPRSIKHSQCAAGQE